MGERGAVKTDIAEKLRSGFAHERSRGSESFIDLRETLVGWLEKGSVGVDGIDKEIGAAIGQGGGRRGKQLRYWFHRGMVVEVHAARSHELEWPLRGQGIENLCPQPLLQFASVEIPRGVVRLFGEIGIDREIPPVKDRRKLVNDGEVRLFGLSG